MRDFRSILHRKRKIPESNPYYDTKATIMGTATSDASAKEDTVYADCGARTNFAPPPASMERLKVKDVDGRTMFDVYEPRYHADEDTSKKKKRRVGSTPPQTLVEILEHRPVAALAVLFVVVLATSATVTALVQR